MQQVSQAARPADAASDKAWPVEAIGGPNP